MILDLGALCSLSGEVPRGSLLAHWTPAPQADTWMGGGGAPVESRGVRPTWEVHSPGPTPATLTARGDIAVENSRPGQGHRADSLGVLLCWLTPWPRN